MFRTSRCRGPSSRSPASCGRPGTSWRTATAFSADDTYRALDTMERLLTAVDATAEADAVRKLRRDAQAAAFSVRDAAGRAGGHRGRGARAQAVAGGDHAAQGRAGREHARRGVRRRPVLGVAGRGVAGVRGPGGVLPPDLPDRRPAGSARGGGAADRRRQERLAGVEPADELRRRQDALDARAVPPAVRHAACRSTRTRCARCSAASLLPAARRAVLVGNHFKAGAATRKPDGTEVQTLWGELAWQLGFSAGGEAEARRAYEIVRSADETRSNPADALGTLIAAYAPCLILIDEWVAYARQLYGRDDLAGGTFDTQFTFAQTLTEAVKAVPGALLVVSIPASSAAPTGEEAERGATDIEVGGLNGRAGPRPAAAGDPPDRRPVAARVVGGVVRDRQAAAVRGSGRRRAGGHRRGRAGVHRLLCAVTGPSSRPGSPSRRMRSGSSRRTRCTRSCSTGCTATGRRWTGSSGPVACCG